MSHRERMSSRRTLLIKSMAINEFRRSILSLYTPFVCRIGSKRVRCRIYEKIKVRPISGAARVRPKTSIQPQRPPAREAVTRLRSAYRNKKKNNQCQQCNHALRLEGALRGCQRL